MPYAGGLMEQPGAALLRMEKVIEAQNEYDKFQAEKEKERGRH
jgi:hypothetical protein